MISNKINNITDWMNEGKIKNTKYQRSTSNNGKSLTLNKVVNQGLFTNTKTLKGYKDLYSIFNTMGPYDVLDYLDSVWEKTTNEKSSIDNFENHLLAVAVYFDFDQSWLNQYSLSVLPSWWWFNSTNKKRPYRNRDLESLRYNYFRLYIISLMDN